MSQVRIYIVDSLRAELGPNGHKEVTAWDVKFYVQDTEEEYALNIAEDYFGYLEDIEDDFTVSIEKAREIWVELMDSYDAIEI